MIAKPLDADRVGKKGLFRHASMMMMFSFVPALSMRSIKREAEYEEYLASARLLDEVCWIR